MSNIITTRGAFFPPDGTALSSRYRRSKCSAVRVTSVFSYDISTRERDATSSIMLSTRCVLAQSCVNRDVIGLSIVATLLIDSYDEGESTEKSSLSDPR